jgi:hypothetical protein
LKADRVAERGSAETNPHRAPEAVVGNPSALPIEYAGKWRRFFNWVIDNVVLLH